MKLRLLIYLGLYKSIVHCIIDAKDEKNKTNELFCA